MDTLLPLTLYRGGIYVHIYIYIYIYTSGLLVVIYVHIYVCIYIYISGLRVISDKCTFLRGKYKSFLVILGHTAAGGNTVYTFLPLTLSPDLESMFIYVHIYIYIHLSTSDSHYTELESMFMYI